MSKYKIWGEALIDQAAKDQMTKACSMLPCTGGALMPDSHVGYSAPIGAVIALENAVFPYGVGVDIGCRMKMSVLDIPVKELTNRHESLCDALRGGTLFGAGKEFGKPNDHEVLERDWSSYPICSKLKDKAHKQLGTSGSGNHFVDLGILEIVCNKWVNRDELGCYKSYNCGDKFLVIISHSGSRGTGHNVCMHYHGLAEKQHPDPTNNKLSWLDMDTQDGQDYWREMNLMGDYSAANHDIIHKSISSLMGAEVITEVENHHNFAWKETHNSKELFVHRKGATPAGAGVLGIIPGSMADYAYVVVGNGESSSLDSASHGAGRQLSRTQGKKTFKWDKVRSDLLTKGITVFGGGADESPGVYKPIDEVMKHQQDLVSIVARFEPKIVVMDPTGSRAED